MRPALAMLLLPGAALAADLGIPAQAPWRRPGMERVRAQSKEVERKASPLEEDFWRRLGAALDSIERSRDGMLQALAYALRHPDVFPPRPVQRPSFEEYEEAAQRTWARAADHWMALESWVGIYRDFDSLPEDKERRAAFFAAYAARLAQARFIKEWSALLANDPSLEESLDAGDASLPPGLYARLKGSSSRRESAEELTDLAAYAARTRAQDPLAELLGARREEWEKRRREDLSRCGARSPHGRPPSPEAVKTLLGTQFPIASRPGDWPAQEPPAPEPAPAEEEKPEQAAENAGASEWTELPISSQMAAVASTLREVLAAEPAPGPRPEALLSRPQTGDMRPRLSPGDILLFRRERFIGSMGLGGYWHEAGIYLGAPEDRKAAFGSEQSNAWMMAEDPEAFSRNAGGSRWGGGRGTAPRAAPADTLIVSTGGVALVSLEAAASDSLAALRPRLAAREKEESLRRAFRLLGKPYDYSLDFDEGSALASPELITAAYRPPPEGSLLWPLQETLGRRAMSANAVAEKFDKDFGTDRQQLDFVLFYDGNEDRRRAESSSLEEFRKSWRRPKWTLEGALARPPGDRP